VSGHGHRPAERDEDAGQRAKTSLESAETKNGADQPRAPVVRVARETLCLTREQGLGEASDLDLARSFRRALASAAAARRSGSTGHSREAPAYLP
jgi:hypothetical protein